MIKHVGDTLAVCLAATFLAFLPLTPARAAEPSMVTTAEYTDVIAKVFPSIVKIEVIQTRPSDGHMIKTWSGGSGVIISAAGHVLTNFHVAETGVYYRCYLTDGTKLEASRVGEDALTDLAVLKLDLTALPKDTKLPVAVFGDSEAVIPGQTVFALGSPGFVSQSVTRGIVANPSLVLPEETAGEMLMHGENVGLLVRWIFHDAPIFHGNSGGALINVRGEVIGINELGLFNLSGAIPSNLAKSVADRLIAKGAIIRGWSGIGIQPRLESDGDKPGVLIADIAPGSPAEAAGLKAGDVITGVDGKPIDAAQEQAISQFYRVEAGHAPGETLTVAYERTGKPATVAVPLARREPAEADDVELQGWGAVVHDLTRSVVREEHLKDENGVWIENIRPAGPAGQAEPELHPGDVIVSVEGKPVTTVAALAQTTAALIKAEPSGKATVLVNVWRSGTLHSAIATLRTTNDHNVTPLARKSWLGASTQPLTVKLGQHLQITAEGGARLTRLYPGAPAEKAGLRVGDILLSVDGESVPERRNDDTEELARMIRQYRPGTEAKLSVWRDGKISEMPITFEAQPIPPDELPWWEDLQLEYSVRDIAFEDIIHLQLDPTTKGAILQTVTLAGWAYLGGLRTNDIVVRADSTPIQNAEDLKQARAEAVKSGRTWWVLQVLRDTETTFVEINLKPTHS